MMENSTSKKLKFCCSLSHSNLERLVKSKKSELSISSSLPLVNCNNLKCSAGAVGCLFHQETNPTKDSTPGLNLNLNEKFTDFKDVDSDEYIDVKPVQLNWEEEDLVLQPKHSERVKRKNDFYDLIEKEIMEIKEASDDDGYQCVHMHLNNEVYR